MLTINAIAKNETKMVKAYAHGYVHVKDPLLTVYGQENDDQMWSYIVMDLNIQTANNIIPCFKGKISVVLKLGIQLIDQLEAIHSAGFIHNDIKPENIVFTREEGKDGEWSAKIAGFINTTCFSDNGLYDTFVKEHFGYRNLMLNSFFHVCAYNTTPRDDMISLGYTLLHLVDQLPYEASYQRTRSLEENNAIQKKMIYAKQALTGADYCKTMLTKPFLNYIEYVHDLDYNEEPYYQKLKHMLITELYDQSKSTR